MLVKVLKREQLHRIEFSQKTYRKYALFERNTSFKKIPVVDKWRPRTSKYVPERASSTMELECKDTVCGMVVVERTAIDELEKTWSKNEMRLVLYAEEIRYHCKGTNERLCSTRHRGQTKYHLVK